MTAVEWFAKQVLRSRQLGFISNEKFNELLEQAKEMEKELNQNKMSYELIAKPNTWDRTFTIRLKYTKGIEKYRTDRLTEDEFKVALTYTKTEWEIYLDTASNYKKI